MFIDQFGMWFRWTLLPLALLVTSAQSASADRWVVVDNFNNGSATGLVRPIGMTFDNGRAVLTPGSLVGAGFSLKRKYVRSAKGVRLFVYASNCASSEYSTLDVNAVMGASGDVLREASLTLTKSAIFGDPDYATIDLSVVDKTTDLSASNTVTSGFTSSTQSDGQKVKLTMLFDQRSTTTLGNRHNALQLIPKRSLNAADREKDISVYLSSDNSDDGCQYAIDQIEVLVP